MFVVFIDLCLQLFVNFNLLSNEIEASYYESKISNELESMSNEDILVPNSSIMKIINLSSFKLNILIIFIQNTILFSDTITEFRLLNEKSRIFTVNDSMKKLFQFGNYKEVVDSLESYIDAFKLVI
jgi:hypothetical protein